MQFRSTPNGVKFSGRLFLWPSDCRVRHVVWCACVARPRAPRMRSGDGPPQVVVCEVDKLLHIGVPAAARFQ